MRAVLGRCQRASVWPFSSDCSFRGARRHDLFRPSLTSGDLFHAVITYHNGSLTIAITDTATGASFQKTISIDIPSVVGGSRAFVGFTGRTAGLAAVQTIYTWTFSGQGP